MGIHLTPRLGLDLGTENTVLASANRIKYSEPTLLVAETRTGKVLYTGRQAAEREGRIPEGMDIVRPIERGVISDYAATVFLLKKVLATAMTPPRIIRPMVVAAVPVSINTVEERALCDAARESGAGQIYLVPCNLATHIDVAQKVTDSQGSLIIDIGYATSNISVIASNEIISGHTMLWGGGDITGNIRSYIEARYEITAGKDEVEKVKRVCGTLGDEKHITIVGKQLEEGERPHKAVKVKGDEVSEVVRHSLGRIIDGIYKTLEDTPPELYEDIYSRGIFLAGGGARLRGISEYLHEKLEIRIVPIHDPEYSAIRGIGKIMASFKHFRQFFKHYVAA